MAKKLKPEDSTSSHSLSWIESKFYQSVHICVVIYITWLIYGASKKYDGLLNVHDFEPGLFQLEKDISNFEWNFFYKWFWKITPFYIGHIAVSKIVEWNYPVYKKFANLSFSILSLVFLMGWRIMTLLVSHCLVIYFVSLTKSRVMVWIVSLGLLSTLNFNITYGWMTLLTNQDREEKEMYILMFTLALTQIKYTSFCLEKCAQVNSAVPSSQSQQHSEDSDKQDTEGTVIVNQEPSPVCQYGVTDLLFYVFYFPLFFTGPIMTYDVFRKQMKITPKVWSRDQIKSIFLGICRILFWTLINNSILHFLYFNAIQNNITVMRDLDLWTLAGIGYWNGQFFMTKYVVLFGYPAIIARLDNLEPVDLPKCVAHIYTYSEMWRYFDRGMYSFMKRYIFIPLGGSRTGLGRQFLASFLCFCFVYIWHGSEYYVFLWAVFNFLGVSVEVFSALLQKTTFIHKFETEYLSPRMVRRLHGFLTVPFFLMSTITAFCFFGGSMIGYIFFKRFFFGSLKSWLTVFGILYCCIQSSMEINRKSKRLIEKEK